MVGRWIAASLLLFLLAGCAFPASSVQREAEDFLREHPGNQGLAEVNHRKVGWHWLGDPRNRPLIFVHGSPGSWQGWAHFLRNRGLLENFYLVAIDRLGYGSSGKGNSEVSLEKQADGLLAVIRHLPTSRKPILVGHSYGGAVIATAAMRAPDQVAGLVFVSSSVAADLEKTKWFQYPASWWPLKHLIPDDLRVCNEEILGLKEGLSKQAADWSKIEGKVAIVHGQSDGLVPVENAHFITRMVDPSRITSQAIIPGLGHFVPWERPDLIEDAISKISAALGSENP